MKKYDKYLKNKINEESDDIPTSIHQKIESTLDSLPEIESPHKQSLFQTHTLSVALASIVFIMLVLLPNISATYANTLEQVPIIGDIVHVITIRNYFYSDPNHEMNIKVPEIKDNGFDTINDDVKELSDKLVKRFYDDLETYGKDAHNAIFVDYEVVTNTKKWFTLKINVQETSGSGNTYYKYYHLNKLTGDIINLGDLSNQKNFYSTIENEIKKQMAERMKKDSNLVYWLDDSELGEDFVTLDAKHNFYIDKDNNLVIPFDKYEVAPGYMGTPEFTINQKLIKDMLKPEIKNLLNNQ